jgi:methyl-accepting chemotaxis protein
MAIATFEREGERVAPRLPGRRIAHPDETYASGGSGGSGGFGGSGAPRDPSGRPSLLRRVTIRQRLWAMATIAVLVFIIMTVIGVLRVGPLIDSNQAGGNTDKAIAALNAAHTDWVYSDDMMESALNSPPIEDLSPGITQTSVDYVTQYYSAALGALDEAIRLIKQDPTESAAAAVQTFEGIRAQVVDYHDTIQMKAIRLMKAGDEVGASKVAIIKAYEPYQAIEAAFAGLVKGADAASAREVAETDDQLSSLRLSLALVALTGTLVFIAAAFFMIRSITRPLQRVVTVLRAIAGGDRSKRLDHKNADEIGSIAVSIQQVIESLDEADEAQASAQAEREAAAAAEQRAAIEKAELETRAAEEKAASEADRIAREAEIEREQRQIEQAAADAERRREQEAAEQERRSAAEVATKAEEDARRVAVMLTYAQALAAGDLTGTLEVQGEDGLGQVAEALRRLAGALRSSIAQIGQTSTSMSSASDLLAGVSSDMTNSSSQASDLAGNVSAAAEQVSANIATVATAAEQMSSSIREIARNASDASSVAANAVQVADQVRGAVTSLDASSAEISQVIKLITSIAQQTNLLALNATIEAARAGDAGKGFAVVANEVKELAGETAKATEEIGRRIDAIQGDTTNAVEAITQITSVIGRINDITGTIASAVEEQTATTNEIARSVTEAATGANGIAADITQVAGAASETQRGAQGTSSAAAELAGMATTLDGLVGAFRY